MITMPLRPGAAAELIGADARFGRAEPGRAAGPPPSGQDEAMGYPRSTASLLPLISAGLVVAGVLVWLLAPAPSYGWFAYTPLPAEVPRPPLGGGWRILAAVLGGAGLVGATAVLVRRRAAAVLRRP